MDNNKYIYSVALKDGSIINYEKDYTFDLDINEFNDERKKFIKLGNNIILKDSIISVEAVKDGEEED